MTRECPRLVKDRVAVELGDGRNTPFLVVYRHQWQCQQAVRSGRINHVTMLESAGNQHIWVPNATPANDNHFLTNSYDGSMILYNADQQPAQPIKLAHRSTCWMQQARMGADNLLHIVESAGAQISGYDSEYDENYVRPSMCWRKISPTSGQTVASLSRPYQSLKEKPVLHLSTGGVLGMADQQTLVVIDSDSLLEISRLSMPSHFADIWVDPRHSRVLEVAWSHTGSMLAVVHASQAALHGYITKQVLVYDTATGACLQQHPVQRIESGNGVLCWSPTLDILALCAWPLTQEGPEIDYGDEDSSGGVVHRGNAVIMVLEPSASRSTVVDCNQDELGPTGMKGCGWSPCGMLLFVPWWQLDTTQQTDALAKQHGFSVVDGHSLRVVFAAKDIFHREMQGGLQWRTGVPSASPNSIKPVSTLWACGMIVDFHQDSLGEWKAAAKQIMELGSSGCTSLSPDRQTLVGVQQHSCLGHVARESSWAQPEILIYSEQDCCRDPFRFLPDQHHALVEWAPFPHAWLPLYAVICQWRPKNKRSRSKEICDGKQTLPNELVLVDSRRHVVVGRWTAAMLRQAASSSQTAAEVHTLQNDNFESLDWAPNGRHLAVLCRDFKFIITFGG